MVRSRYRRFVPPEDDPPAPVPEVSPVEEPRPLEPVEPVDDPLEPEPLIPEPEEPVDDPLLPEPIEPPLPPALVPAPIDDDEPERELPVAPDEPPVLPPALPPPAPPPCANTHAVASIVPASAILVKIDFTFILSPRERTRPLENERLEIFENATTRTVLRRFVGVAMKVA
jgi:hypothetical protein